MSVERSLLVETSREFRWVVPSERLLRDQGPTASPRPARRMISFRVLSEAKAWLTSLRNPARSGVRSRASSLTGLGMPRLPARKLGLKQARVVREPLADRSRWYS